MRSIRAEAEALAREGRADEGEALLRARGAAGNGEAWFVLAVWYASGDWRGRDLAEARALFGRAEAAGHGAASPILTNFMAAGVGGPRDWPAALARLARADDGHSRRQAALLSAMALDADGDPAAPVAGERVSEAPDVQLWRGLFSAAECDYLIRAAVPLMRPSLVVDERTGERVRHPVRTADAALFTWPLESPVVHALNRRIAKASDTAPDAGEPLQVLRYAPGQEYRRHLDALPGLDNQRAWTMLVWLNDDYAAGETLFPEAGLSLRGRAGDALLFGNLGPDGRPDPASAHAGAPVTDGTKFLASRWIRERAFTA